MITNLVSFLLHVLEEEMLFYVWIACKFFPYLDAMQFFLAAALLHKNNCVAFFSVRKYKNDWDNYGWVGTSWWRW